MHKKLIDYKYKVEWKLCEVW